MFLGKKKHRWNGIAFKWDVTHNNRNNIIAESTGYGQHFERWGMSISLAFFICSGGGGGGVGAGMPLCWVPVFGDKHCCGGNVWKGPSAGSEWGRLCFLCASSREAVTHRPSPAKQRPKERPQIPFKMILMIFKCFLHLELRFVQAVDLSFTK